jgi:glycosyltransferase involved in cell wall biosynthesis
VAKTILQLIETTEPGGAETVVLNLCQGLRRAGHRPIAGLFREGWLAEQLRKTGTEVIVFENRYGLDPFFLFRLVQTILQRRVEVIHAHEFMMNVYGTMAGRLTGRPVVATLHGKVYFFRKRRRQIAYRWVAKYADHFVAVSEDLKTFVAQTGKIDPSRIRVVYNGIDTAKYDGASQRSAADWAGFEVCTPIIGTVGNLYPGKGYPDLFKAAKKVVHEFPSATFLIIGGDFAKYGAAFKAEVATLGLEKNVKFMGFREDVADFLSIIDLFVLPSLSEGLSLAVLQAMSSEKAVVVSKVGGNLEVIADEKMGCLVPPQQSDLLAEAILALLRNPDRGRQIGIAARKRVVECFSADAMLDHYLYLYGGEGERSIGTSGGTS